MSTRVPTTGPPLVPEHGQPLGKETIAYMRVIYASAAERGMTRDHLRRHWSEKIAAFTADLPDVGDGRDDFRQYLEERIAEFRSMLEIDALMDQASRKRPEPREDKCYCCGYTTVLAPYRPPITKPGNEDEVALCDEDYWQWFCALCAGSYASTARQYRHDNQLLHATVCYVGNHLLAEIQKVTTHTLVLQRTVGRRGDAKAVVSELERGSGDE